MQNSGREEGQIPASLEIYTRICTRGQINGTERRWRNRRGMGKGDFPKGSSKLTRNRAGPMLLGNSLWANAIAKGSARMHACENLISFYLTLTRDYPDFRSS